MTTVSLRHLDRGLYLPEADTLVVADLHLGRDATSAVTMPVGEAEAVLDLLEGHLETVAPETVVLAGDVLHAHGGVPSGVPETVSALRESVRTAGATLRVARGNHDTHLEAVGLADVSQDAVRLGDTVVCHGHEDPAVRATVDRYVVGHEHPAVEIEGRRHPCALVGPAAGSTGDAEVVVLPAFSPLAPGTVVNTRRDDPLSPLIEDLAAFRPVVVGEDVHRFPRLGELRVYL